MGLRTRLSKSCLAIRTGFSALGVSFNTTLKGICLVTVTAVNNVLLDLFPLFLFCLSSVTAVQCCFICVSITLVAD